MIYETTSEAVMSFLKAIKYDYIHYEFRGKRKRNLIAKILIKNAELKDNPLNYIIGDIIKIVGKNVYTNMESLFHVIGEGFYNFQKEINKNCGCHTVHMFPKDARVIGNHNFKILATTADSLVCKRALKDSSLKLFSKIYVHQFNYLVQDIKSAEDNIDVNKEEKAILIFTQKCLLEGYFTRIYGFELVDVHEFLFNGENVRKVRRCKLFENKDYLVFKSDKLFPTYVTKDTEGNSFIICRKIEPHSKRNALHPPFLIWYEKSDGTFYNELKIGYQKVKTTVKALVEDERANDSNLRFCIIQENFILAVLGSCYSLIDFDPLYSYVMLYIHDFTRKSPDNSKSTGPVILSRISLNSEIIKNRPYLALINSQSIEYNSEKRSCYLSEKLNFGRVKPPVFGIQSGKTNLSWFTKNPFDISSIKKAPDIYVLFYEDK